MTAVLALDTATEACSAAIFLDGELTERYLVSPNSHSQLILEMVTEVLDAGNLALKDIDVIAVNTGPGSFTGVRIGIGVAQGLAYGAGRPAIGVCSLEILAAMSSPGRTMPAIDARMSQVYCGVYDVREGARPVQIEAPVVCAPDKLPFDTGYIDYGIGSGWGVYGNSLNSALEDSGFHLMEPQFPRAGSLASLVAKTQNTEWMLPMDLEASYVRNQVVGNPALPSR